MDGQPRIGLGHSYLLGEAWGQRWKVTMWEAAGGQRQENNCMVPRGQEEMEAQFGAKAKRQKKMNTMVSGESCPRKVPGMHPGLQ